MFGHHYYGAHFFGPHYFGDGGSVAPPVHGDYFGDRFFSTAFFGPRYWGGVKHALGPPTPPVTTTEHLARIASINRGMTRK